MPPSGCQTGYQTYNSPEGCAHFICSEDYATIKAADDANVAAALTAKRDEGVTFGVNYNYDY
jgi:hypothetical protein